MNLLFTSRVHPANLRAAARAGLSVGHRGRCGAGALMIAAAVTLRTRTRLAGLVMALSTVVLLSLALIEPATTRAAGLSG